MMHKYTGIGIAILVLGIAAVGAAQDSVPATPVTVQEGPPAEPAPEASLPPLHVGMPAPPLKVAQWFKGTPVNRLEPGKVYVIEFWATWCGPCRRSIPHVTELAKKYGDKVTMIGVSVFERPKEKTNEAIAALVEPFVKEMGDKMGYTVAADDPNRTVANAWLIPAGQGGIPCAFIIDRDGKIAWIGHPMTMDAVLEAVVAGTFDAQAEAARQIEEKKKQQELMRLVEPIKRALAAKDPNAVIKAVDAVLAARPELEEQLMPVRLYALLDVNEVSAFGYLKTLAEKGFFDKHPRLAAAAVDVILPRAGTMKQPDWPTLLSILQKANEARENKDWQLLSAYARILAQAGQIDKAIEIQQKAVDTATPLVGTAIPQGELDRQKQLLDEYKARKN